MAIHEMLVLPGDTLGEGLSDVRSITTRERFIIIYDNESIEFNENERST